MVVEVSKLNNGITIVSQSMPHLASTALGVWVAAGSRTETTAESGISHLLEHMAFKGTRRRSATAIAEEIENVGGELNAATSIESTSYYARVLAGDLPLALDILSDIIQDSVFDPTELVREKHVITQEIGASLDTPEDLVFDFFQEAAFPEQPIGRPILGSVETVTGFDNAALRHYLARQYVGPRTVISAAGKMDHAELVRMASERFEGYAHAAPPPEAVAVYRGGERREERDLMEAQIVLGFKGATYHSSDFMTAQIAASVLGGGMSSRLFQEIRERRGLCYSVYAFHWAYSDDGLFGIHAATGGDDAATLVDATIEELKRAAETISEAEVARARAQLRAGLLMTLESPAARAGQIARHILFHGRAIPLDEMVREINRVGVQDVRNFIVRLMTQAPPTLSAIGPIKGLPGLDVIAGKLGAPMPPLIQAPLHQPRKARRAR
ncbi:Protease 3 precursor [Hartmannibacter diazotrophicus]|uniref:Protease 3 n=1 Tax=Hartmannibacter diazotrophicus TaxID=1482074 RepID=A0A2C9D324_9HYPH|nr:pitrilysin family protein [Hartmannibacter diazotrophicus]SON54666.1 Protease 3 precursor [Hartmannibacter diazotrophicus]